MTLAPDKAPVNIRDPKERYWEREHRRELGVVMNRDGFYFHTLKEGDKINDLTPRPNRAKPVLAYFNMIGRTNAEPRTATSMALDTFIDYAGKSLDNIRYIQKLENILIAGEPDKTFLGIFPTVDWQFDRDRVAQLTVLARFQETKVFIEGGRYDSLIEKHRLDKKEHGDRVDAIIEDLGSLSAEELLELAAEVIESEKSRAIYWKEKVEAASDYDYVREQAEDALGVLNARFMEVDVLK